MTSEAPRPVEPHAGQPRGLTRTLRLVFWSALLWTALAVFFASQLYFAGLPWRGYAAQVRQRERQSAEMALRTTDLERRLVETRLQSLRAQLQPHFLFNALNTISAFTETNPQVARRLMGQLGNLLRASLTHTAQPRISLGDELTFLDDYVAIESARFEGRIVVLVSADDDVLAELVPSLLLQPLVENAIKHGVVPKLSGGRVEVTATRDGTFLQLRVRDTGIGLPGGWEFSRHAGVGLRNVAARLEHLYGRDDLLRLSPIESGGVEVQIGLPMEPLPRPPAASAPGEATNG